MVSHPPITTEREHELAMAEIEQLWGAPVGSDEEGRLDVLATLVDAYESARFPFNPPDPIDTLLFRLEQQGLI